MLEDSEERRKMGKTCELCDMMKMPSSLDLYACLLSQMFGMLS